MSTSNFFKKNRTPVRALRDDYGMGLIDLTPSPNRFKNYPLNILNSKNGPEIRFPSLKFKNYYSGQMMEIQLNYSINTGNFSVREVARKIYTDESGIEHLISSNDFFSKSSKNRRIVNTEDGKTYSEYVVPGTEEVLTKEVFNKLPASDIDSIETGARMYICDIFAEYMRNCQYLVNVDLIKDVRPDTDYNGNQVTLKRFDQQELADISNDINAFIKNKRMAVLESRSEKEAPKEAIGL